MYHILQSKGPAATPKEIASHFNVIMMAGTVTTATFLSGVLYYLGHNRQALKRLQDEIRSTFSHIENINSKDLLNCVYLNAVVEEGLRIYPPAGAAHLSRIVPQKGCVISESFIPKGVSSSSAFILYSFPSSLLSLSRLAILQSHSFKKPVLHSSSYLGTCIRPPLVRPSRSRQLSRAIAVYP